MILTIDGGQILSAIYHSRFDGPSPQKFLFRRINIVDNMFKMLEKYSNDLEETVEKRTLALEDEKKKTENLLTQMLPQ